MPKVRTQVQHAECQSYRHVDCVGSLTDKRSKMPEDPSPGDPNPEGWGPEGQHR